MACPHFYPTVKLQGGPLAVLPFPLGDMYAGECRAGAECPPDDEALRTCCNLGYAGGRCPLFPVSGPDAVRFSISSDSGDCIRVAYAVERNHWPHAHGALEYAPSTGRLTVTCLDVAIERQATVYIESYLRRKPRD